MNFIEKHSKILAVSLCLLTSGPIVSTMYAKEVQPGWHGEGADRYYVLKSNRQTATGLTKIDKELYYFNNNELIYLELITKNIFLYHILFKLLNI